jgi:hypothetical protein
MIVNVSKEEMEAMEARWAAKDAAMAEKMPTEADALRQMFEAWERLKQLGWNDACYCPKDGSMFSVIEPGSTGIHKCNYTGDWPKGHWWIYDGDVWPARPILWRPRKPEDPVVNKGLAMDYDCRCVGHNVELTGAARLYRAASSDRRERG